MTDREAIEIIKGTPLYRYETDRDGQSDLFKALHRAVLALEKQIPRETVINEEEGYIECPSCGGMISYTDDPTSHKFCLKCGQAFACNYLQYADNETAQSGLMPAT